METFFDLGPLDTPDWPITKSSHFYVGNSKRFRNVSQDLGAVFTSLNATESCPINIQYYNIWTTPKPYRVNYLKLNVCKLSMKLVETRQNYNPELWALAKSYWLAFRHDDIWNVFV